MYLYLLRGISRSRFTEDMAKALTNEGKNSYEIFNELNEMLHPPAPSSAPLAGANGTDGTDGTAGATGAAGATGTAGATGNPAPAHPKYNNGVEQDVQYKAIFPQTASQNQTIINPNKMKSNEELIAEVSTWITESKLAPGLMLPALAWGADGVNPNGQFVPAAKKHKHNDIVGWWAAGSGLRGA